MPPGRRYVAMVALHKCASVYKLTVVGFRGTRSGDENVQNEDGIANTGSVDQDKKIYFYEGSVLPVEWTNQHGCGQNSKVRPSQRTDSLALDLRWIP